MRNLLAITILFFTGGCMILKPGEKFAVRQIPASFGNTGDTVNSRLINWKDFYSDPALVKLIDTALVNNFDLQVALQRIEIARSQMNLNKGVLYPSVQLSAGAGQKKVGEYTMDGVGNFDTRLSKNLSKDQLIPNPIPDYQVSLLASWEADLWGKLRSRKKASVARLIATEKARHLITTNLVAQVAITYYELLSLDNELQIILENIRLQENALALVIIQKEAGRATELAVKQFESQLLNSRSFGAEVEQQIFECENKLNFLLGKYPQPIIRTEVFLETKLPKQINAGLPADLLINRPDIQQAEFDLVAAKADLMAAKSAFYPSFNLSATAGFQAFNSAFIFESPGSAVYQIAGGLVAPLINRNAIKAEFKNASAHQIQSYVQYQKSIVNGYVEVYNELQNIKMLEKLYSLKSLEVSALNRSIEVSGDLFTSGKASYLEIISAQKNALNSKMELVNTRKRQFHSVVNLYKALGGGWK